MNWVVDNLGLILELTLVHLRQSIIPIILGFVLSLPLGWVAWRFRLVRGPIIVLTGLLYTIPSLALLILLPSVAGYSARSEANLVIALTIYAIAILVRAVSDGLDSVDDDVRQSATATGFASFRRFLGGGVPARGPRDPRGPARDGGEHHLARHGRHPDRCDEPRVPLHQRLDRRIIAEVFAGVIAVVVIALLIDLILLLLGRALMPWTRAASKKATARPVIVGAPA